MWSPGFAFNKLVANRRSKSPNNLATIPESKKEITPTKRTLAGSRRPCDCGKQRPVVQIRLSAYNMDMTPLTNRQQPSRGCQPANSRPTRRKQQPRQPLGATKSVAQIAADTSMMTMTTTTTTTTTEMILVLVPTAHCTLLSAAIVDALRSNEPISAQDCLETLLNIIHSSYN